MNQEPHRKLDDAASGLGIGLGLIAAGMLTLWIPGYLDATEGWRTLWLTLGGMLALTGTAGAAIEFGRLTGTEGFGDVGAGIAVAGLAGIFHVLQATVAEGRVASVLRFVTVALLLFAPTGIGRGIARVALAQRVRRDGAAGGKALSFITAVIGLATAVLAFLQAASG